MENKMEIERVNKNEKEVIETKKDVDKLHDNEHAYDYDTAVKNLSKPVAKGLLTTLDAPICPLCHNKMELIKDPVRDIYAWACHEDRIAINILDPLVGKWQLKETEKIPCLNPKCKGEPMRMFFTITGYMKAKCPKCGMSVANGNTERKAPALKKDGWA